MLSQSLNSEKQNVDITVTMDTDLVKCMCDIVTEVRKKKHGMSENIEQYLKKFYTLLNKATQPELTNLKITYNSELFDIKYNIENQFRSWHDKIFISILHIKKLPQNTTHIFEEFIKGITYFYDEIDQTHPIYHRLYSCGPYRDTHRLGNLICVETLSDEEIKRRKPLIERCYVERLIYDEIYKHESLHFPPSGNVEPTQNDGHLFRLDLTRQDYESCFPGCSVEIQVEYKNENYPMILTLKKTHRNGKQTVHRWSKNMKDSSIIGGPHYGNFVEYSVQSENGKKKLQTVSFNLSGRMFKLL